jgi:uncharacterized short protein YbdD (DUF466 family)
VRSFLQKIAATLRLMVGVGDYGAYVKHCIEHHPDMPVPSREDWYRARVDARYGAKNGVHRCPC